MQPTKHFAKKVCIFNVLQQIKLICAVFIHILSTKTGKCAIYKANFFAFAECPHTNAHVHYIKTNNKLYLQPFACVRVRFGVCCTRFLTTTTKLTTFAKITTTTKYVIYLCPCSCVLCRVLLRWINTYYLCAVCRVRAW